MHAVVVCSRKNGASNFATYPDVLTPIEDVKNEAVITRDYDGNWIWKPQATGSEIKRLQSHQQKYPKYRRWEHVAFAFHIPDEWGEDGIITAGHPEDHQKFTDVLSRQYCRSK